MSTQHLPYLLQFPTGRFAGERRPVATASKATWFADAGQAHDQARQRKLVSYTVRRMTRAEWRVFEAWVRKTEAKTQAFMAAMAAQA